MRFRLKLGCWLAGMVVLGLVATNMLAGDSVVGAQTNASQTGPTDGWSFVATVDGGDAITHSHLAALLKAHKIECSIGGSVVYGVSVPAAKYAEAVKIITKDLRERQYNITIYADGKDIKHSVPQEAWQASEPKMKLQELLAREDYGPSTDIGRLLRAPEIMNESLAFPFVVRIRSMERTYMDDHQKIQIGHQFDIELAASLNEEIGGKRLYFQVWDSGKHIQGRGSNEWWHGTPETVASNKAKYDKRKAEKVSDNHGAAKER